MPVCDLGRYERSESLITGDVGKSKGIWTISGFYKICLRVLSFARDRTRRHLGSNFSRTAHWISTKFEMPFVASHNMKGASSSYRGRLQDIFYYIGVLD